METNPEAGVMVASPASIPDATPSTLGLPLCHHSQKAQLSAAAEAEKCVAANALVASLPAFTALPALKPNQPTQTNPGPTRSGPTLGGGIGSRGWPRRWPKTSAQRSAETPELMCTPVPPAKPSTGMVPPSAQLKYPP